MAQTVVDELDKEFWLPTKINELSQKGVRNVAHKTVPLLPKLQRNRVLRAVEKAIQTELKNLSEDEFAKLETKMDELVHDLPRKRVILFELKYSDGIDPSFTTGHQVFTNERIAAQALFNHLDENYCKSLEECLQLVKSKSEDDKYTYVRTDSDHSICIYHIECNQINQTD